MTDYKDWSSQFTGHGLGDDVTSPESYVNTLFQRVDDAAVARVAGDVPVDPNGDDIADVFITPEGHDIQRITPSLSGWRSRSLRLRTTIWTTTQTVKGCWRATPSTSKW